MAEIGQGGGRLNIRRQAVPEDGCSNWKCQCVDVPSASSKPSPRARCASLPCEQKCLEHVPESSFGGAFELRTGSGRLFQADRPAMTKVRRWSYILSRCYLGIRSNWVQMQFTMSICPSLLSGQAETRKSTIFASFASAARASGHLGVVYLFPLVAINARHRPFGMPLMCRSDPWISEARNAFGPRIWFGPSRWQADLPDNRRRNGRVQIFMVPIS